MSRSGWPAACRGGCGSTPTVTPLTRHSMRPMPPPLLGDLDLRGHLLAVARVPSRGDTSVTAGALPLASTLVRSSRAAASRTSPRGSPASFSRTRSGR